MLEELSSVQLNRLHIVAGCDQASLTVTMIYNTADEETKENIRVNIEESPFFTPYIKSGSPTKSLKSGVDVGRVEQIHIGGVFTTNKANSATVGNDEDYDDVEIGSLTYSTLSLPSNPRVVERAEPYHVKEHILNKALQLMGEEVLLEGEDEDSTRIFVTTDRVFKVEMPFVYRETATIQEVMEQLDIGEAFPTSLAVPLPLPMAVSTPTVTSKDTMSVYSMASRLPEVYPRQARVHPSGKIQRKHRHWYQRLWDHYWGNTLPNNAL